MTSVSPPRARLFAALALELLATAPLAAQAPERPLATSTRTETPPVIDGRLDDAAWQLARPIGELTQLEPLAGVPASEASDIRFLHDDHYLYMAVRCFDREPERIVATTRERDAFLDVDDRVEIVFDTFHDRRNAFFFQISAGGSKGDALVTNNGANFNKPWDGLWEGHATVDELGWSAELALPFKTLAFRPGQETWGFNVLRHIGRKREDARWANPSRDFSLFNVYRAGDLAGLEGIRQGIGVDVVPFFVSHWRNERDEDGDGRADGSGDKTLDGEPGFDLFYKIIPSLTFALTVNTDFAETEVDERQINLTRFPLFFPERRDFFLQDAGVFEFGDRAAIPFFSRRIGLLAGEEVPILGGAKLTGRAGPWGIGVLDVQTDSVDTDALGDVDGQNLFAGRISRNVGAQSTVGGIVTNGDPSGVADNTLVGVDATHRASVLSDGRDLVTTAFALYSETEDVSGEEAAFGLAFAAPGDLVSWRVGALEIQEDFRAALGFVPRPDIRRFDGSLQYEPRPDVDALRQLEFGIGTEVFTDTDGELETWSSTVQPLGLIFESGEEARFALEHTRDVLVEPFDIQEDVEIAEGEYDFTRGSLELGTGQQRELSAELSLDAGEFYDGRRRGYGVALTWQPGPFFNGSCGYARDDVSLQGGDFDTQLARLRANVSFSPEITWNSFVQWDNESDTFGIQSRLRWIPVPHQEVFLVFNETLESDSSRSAPLSQELAFKITYAVRF